MMGLTVNRVAAAVLAVSILFYVFVYTIWLKRRTPQNIVIGGAAGAFPPMIGWAAATGDVSAVGIALFLLIFLWTPPHFWALALYRSDDYRRAGVPMQRYGTSEEVAATIAFLASTGAGYITGQNIKVDGGLMRSV